MIGPQFPPAAKKHKLHDDEGEASSDGDEVGPQLSAAGRGPAKKQRKLESSIPSGTTGDIEGTSSDDDFGPSLPDSNIKTVAITAPSSASEQSSRPVSSVATSAKRDDWMTVAPRNGDWASRQDLTKIKSRKFNTSKSSNTSGTIAKTWTDMPGQKRDVTQKLTSGDKTTIDSEVRNTRQGIDGDNMEMPAAVVEYSSKRGPSLYEAHQRDKKQYDDDPSARAFDREKDVGGATLDATKRKDFIKKASDFSSRFSSGKYL